MGSSFSQEMNPVVIEPKDKHKGTLFFLHGLADTGHGWADGLKGLNVKHLRIVCPHATSSPVSINAGMSMPSWFDIYGFNSDSRQDTDGIKQASCLLQKMADDEHARGIARRNIFIGGFSQGGAVALYTALSSGKQFGGVVALSTWLPLHKTLMSQQPPNQDMPILQCHGINDPLVQLQLAEQTHQLVKSLNPNTVFNTYPDLAHCSCKEEMLSVKQFLEAHLDTESSAPDSSS